MNEERFSVGDRVLLKSTGEVGIVVWTWDDEVLGADTYVAFFGNEFPVGAPEKKPYVLRYASSSLMRAPKGADE
jgi:hypothetical protein